MTRDDWITGELDLLVASGEIGDKHRRARCAEPMSDSQKLDLVIKMVMELNNKVEVIQQILERKEKNDAEDAGNDVFKENKDGAEEEAKRADGEEEAKRAEKMVEMVKRVKMLSIAMDHLTMIKQTILVVLTPMPTMEETMNTQRTLMKILKTHILLLLILWRVKSMLGKLKMMVERMIRIQKSLPMLLVMMMSLPKFLTLMKNQEKHG